MARGHGTYLLLNVPLRDPGQFGRHRARADVFRPSEPLRPGRQVGDLGGREEDQAALLVAGRDAPDFNVGDPFQSDHAP
jgi:hypothetical protein